MSQAISHHPEEGQEWTYTTRQGDVRHYIVTMAEAAETSGAVVYLRNEATGRQAMLTVHTVIHDSAWQPA